MIVSGSVVLKSGIIFPFFLIQGGPRCDFFVCFFFFRFQPAPAVGMFPHPSGQALLEHLVEHSRHLSRWEAVKIGAVFRSFFATFFEEFFF